MLESDASPDGTIPAWSEVCRGSCEKRVDASGIFRVAGEGYHPTREFELPEGRERVAVNAKMKVSSVGVPVTLCVLGGVFLTLSAAMLTGGEERYLAPGLIIAGGGAAMTGVGVYVLVSRDDGSTVHVARTRARTLAISAGFVY